jgi:hypothetical protein
MYKYPINIFLTLFLLATMSFHVFAKNNTVKVYDKGQDGGNRIYSVTCPNGKKTSVTKTINTSAEIQNFEKQQQTIELDTNLKEGKSIKSTAEDIKKRALRLMGQQNRAEICLYPINSKKQCKNYKDVDTAARAACDLLQ